MTPYVKLMRPQHYIKNILLFLPIVFGGELLNFALFFRTVLAFLVFCLSASFVYIINDIRDVDQDRNHPVKKKRPIAAGKISVKKAWFMAAILFGLLLFINFSMTGLTWETKLVPIFYIVINLLYSMGWKNIPILDIFILTTGFVLRVVYGGGVTSIPISSWLYLTVFSLSFYLGLGKRRNEINNTNGAGRPVLKGYSYEFLDKNMYVFLTTAIVFYAMWCVNFIDGGGSRYIIFSVPLAMLICMKYSLTIEGDSMGDPIEVFLQDKLLIFLVLIYSAVMFLAVYV